MPEETPITPDVATANPFAGLTAADEAAADALIAETLGEAPNAAAADVADAALAVPAEPEAAPVRPPLADHVVLGGKKLKVFIGDELSLLQANEAQRRLLALQRKMERVGSEVRLWVERVKVETRTDLTRVDVALNPEAKAKAEYFGVTDEHFDIAESLPNHDGSVPVWVTPNQEEQEKKFGLLLLEAASEDLYELVALLSTPPLAIEKTTHDKTLGKYLYNRAVQLQAQGRPQESQGILAWVFDFADRGIPTPENEDAEGNPQTAA